MKRRYWAPLLAIAAAILILVPTTLARGEPGTNLYATLQTNRFPLGNTFATATLHFTNGGADLTVNVQGSDLRNWTIRIYDLGSCNNVLEWVANRGANGEPLQKVATNQGPLTQVLFSGDYVRIQNGLAAGRNMALMLAGSGSGAANSGSQYRTCTSFGPVQVPVTTSTTTTNTSTAPGPRASQRGRPQSP